jgi:hypothetical protein
MVFTNLFYLDIQVALTRTATQCPSGLRLSSSREMHSSKYELYMGSTSPLKFATSLQHGLRRKCGMFISLH